MKKRWIRLMSLIATVTLISSTTNNLVAKASDEDYSKFKINLLDEEKVRKSIQKNLFEKSKIKEETNENIIFRNLENGRVRVIVELDGSSVNDLRGNQELSKAANSSLRTQVLNTQESVKQAIANNIPNVEFKNSFSIFQNAFSIDVDKDSVKDLEKVLKSYTNVKSIVTANKYILDMTTAGSLTKVSDAWNEYKTKGEGMVVAIIDTGIDVSHKDMRISDSSKVKIKKEDIEGQNGKYNTINQKGKYYTEKVPYGHNFADNSDDVKDADSMHGMHVAGIVGANAIEEDLNVSDGIKGIRGVAPEAQLLAMKVFSNNRNYASALSDNIVAAIEESVAHGADVINMSLGSPSGFVNPDDIEQKAIKEASEAGVVCVLSAGNSGISTADLTNKWWKKYPNNVDESTIGTPGLSNEALSVASFNNSEIKGNSFTLTDSKGNKQLIYYNVASDIDPLSRFDPGEVYEYVDCGLGYPSDFVGKDLRNKIALIKRGELGFIDKKLNAQNAGASAVILYNNVPSNSINPATREDILIPSVMLTLEDGTKLLEGLKSGSKITFNEKITSTPNYNLRDNMSNFSSFGPTPNLMLRPFISAPGGNIYSTVNDNKYQDMSGTSMAAPHMAGLTALLLQNMGQEPEFNMKKLKGIEKVNLAKTMLVNTAEVKMDPNTGRKLPFSPRRQGAGLANIEAAIKNRVSATFEENEEPVISLKNITPTNDGAERTFKIKLKNYSAKAVKYEIKDKYGVMTEQNTVFSAMDAANMTFDVPYKDASLNFKTKEIEVPAVGEATVEVTLKVNPTKNQNVFLEGFISLESKTDGMPSIGMPYLAFYGDWQSLPIVDAPIWQRNSIWKTTSLINIHEGEPSLLGIDSDNNGNLFLNPNIIGINPENEFAYTNVGPRLALLRNAKKFNISIYDSAKNLVRNLFFEDNIPKTCVNNGKIIRQYMDPAFQWDGTIYDNREGKFKFAEDGQYYIGINTKVDYENAQNQQVLLPFKVDKISPQIEYLDVKESEKGIYDLKFKVSDIGTGLKGVVVICDNKEYKFDGEIIVKPQLDEEGYYNLRINVEEEGFHSIALAAVDNAGNASFKEAQCQDLFIVTPQNGEAFATGDFDVELFTNPNLINKLKGYELLISKAGENKFKKIDYMDASKLKFKVKNLPAGEYTLAVKAVLADDPENNSYVTFKNIKVKENGVDLKILSPSVNQYYNFKNAENGVITLKGSLNINPSMLKINDDVIDENSIIKTPEGYEFETKLKLNPGLNKISVYADIKDSFGNIKSKDAYAIPVYYEEKEPTLKVNEASSIDSVYVKNDAVETTITGECESALRGYALRINGNQVLNVYDEASVTPSPINTKRQFEYTEKLDSNNTFLDLELESVSGIKVNKKVVVRKLDYFDEGITFNNLTDNMTCNEEKFIISGYCDSSKVKAIVVNDKKYPIDNSKDSFAIDCTPSNRGESKLNIKVLGTDDKIKEIKEVTLNYNYFNSIPVITMLDGQTEDFINVDEKTEEYELKFKVEDEQDFTVKVMNIINGNVISEERVNKGSKEFNVKVPLELGGNLFMVEAINDSGKQQARLKGITRGDNGISMPEVGIGFKEPLIDGIYVSSHTFRIEGKAFKELSKFKINDIDVPLNLDGTFNVSVPLNNQGENKISIEAETKADKVEDVVKAQKTFTVNYDSIAPSIILNDIKKNVSASEKTIEITGQIQDKSENRLFINGMVVPQDEKGNFKQIIPLNDGQNTVSILCVDRALNVSSKVIDINKPSTSSTNIKGLTINGVNVEEFNNDTLTYNRIVEAIENKVPDVGVVLNELDENTVEIKAAKGIPGTTIIEVTAKDGTKKEFKVNFIRAIDLNLVKSEIKMTDKAITAEISYLARNNMNKNSDVTLIAALYDGTKMITVNSVTTNLGGGATAMLTSTFDIPHVGPNAIIKYYCVDSISGVKLLSEERVIDIK